MKNIKIGIKLDKSGFQKEISQLLNGNYNIKLDNGSFKTSISEINKELSRLKTTLSNINTNSFTSASNGIKNAKKATEELNTELERMSGKNLASTSIIADKNGLAEINKYKDGIGQVTTEVIRNGEVTRQTVTENIAQFEKLRNQMQGKLTTASNNGFVDTSVIDKLQSKLNNLNTNIPEKEFNELKSAINNLSSSDSGIVRIQNTLVKLQDRIAEIKKDKIDLINTAEINELKLAENEVKRLGDMLKSLQSGNTIDGKAISNQINVANNSVRTLEKSFNDLDSTTDNLSSTMKDIFSYALGGSAFYAFMNSIKSAVDTTIELDSAMRDLRRVSEETNSTYSKFMKTANQTAIELGTTTTGAIEAVTRFVQLGYSFDDASESLSRYALMLSNVADMSASDASSAIVSVLKGFQLETEDVGRIVDIINESGNKFALDSNSLAEGLKIGAANLSIAGNDLEQASAMIIAGTEVMQDSLTVSNGLKTIGMRLRGVSEDGEELNASLGELIKKLTGVDLTDANGEFRSTYDVLVDISKVFDTLNSKEQALLLEEIAGKNRANVLAAILQNAEQLENAYDTLKDSAGSASAEQEAYMDSLQGKINALKESLTSISMQMIDSDIFKGLVDGATSGVTAISKFMETFGSFPTIVTGVTGAITVLNKSFRENLQTVTSTIPGIGALQDKMNSYVSSLNGQIQAIKANISEKKKDIAQNISNGESTNALSKEVLGLEKQLISATMASVATRVAMVALQAVATSLMSFGISMLISGFTKLVDSMVLTKTELKELNDEFSNTVGESSAVKLNDLIDKYEELDNKLKNAKDGTYAYKVTEQELASIQEQIIALYPQASELIDNNTEAKRLNLEKTKELASEELAILKSRAYTTLDKNNIANTDDIKTAIKDYEVYKKVIEEINKMKDENKSGSTTIDVGDWNDSGKLAFSTKDIEVYTKRLEETKSKLTATLEATKLVEEGNEEYEGSVYLLEKALGLVNEEINNTKNSIDELNNSDTSSGLENMKTSAESATEAIDELNKVLSGLKDNNEIIQQAIDEFTEYGELTEDTFDKILSNGSPEMIAALGDANTFLETYNRLLAEGTEQAELQRKAIIENANAILGIGDSMAQVTDQNAENYSIDLQNQANATDAKLKNSILYADESSKSVADSVTNNSKNYSIDSENLRGSIRNKLQNADDFANGAMNGVATFVTNAGQNYKTDADNFVTQTNVKIKAMEMLQDTLDSFASNKIEFGGGRGILNPDSITINKTGGMLKGNYASSGIGYTSGTANKVSSGATSGVGHSASGTSGTGSTASSNSATQKEVANMEKIEDRYYYLTKAIEEYNNAIDKNKLLQETANDAEKVRLMKEEIALYEKQRQAVIALNNEQKKEAEELKKTLYNGGFRFDNTGNIIDINGEFARKVAKANSMTNPEEKEKYIAFVKEMEEATKRYTDLIQDLIPKQEQEWISLGNTIADTKEEIKEIYKEQLSLVSSQEKEIADVVEYYAQKQYEAKKEKIEKELELERKRIEGIKESLSKEKELYNKNIQEDDYNANLAKERNKLAEIQAEIDRLSLDNSAKGKQLLAQALKDYEAQQQVISDMIKENQQQITNDRFDSEMEMLDKELETTEEKFDSILEELDKNLEEFLNPENLNKIIEQGLKTGMITVGEEVMNVQQAMKSMLEQSEYGIVNVITQTAEWIESLKEVQSIYGSINSVISNAGISTASLPNGNSRSITVNTGDFIVQGGIDKDVLPEVQRMLDQQRADIYRDISNQLRY